VWIGGGIYEQLLKD